MSSNSSPRWRRALVLGVAALGLGYMLGGCQNQTSPGGSASGLRIGSLLPATGDLASVGQPMINAVPLLVKTVNRCGGVNGAPVTLFAEDDQTDPRAGAEAMTKLAEVDRVAGVVGSFASSVSSAAVGIAVRDHVMLISPGSTSPVFTQEAAAGKFHGYWARTVPPDTYQALALADLAYQRGLRRVSTIVINNDYGVGFEQAFTKDFTRLGGTILDQSQPVRYDPKATTFDTEAAEAFANHPDGVAAILYAETGSLILKSAYQQGLSKGVQILLTDGVDSPDFPKQVGVAPNGSYILAGAIGTVPAAHGKALRALAKLWQATYHRPLSPYVPQAWDAAALLVLAAQAAHANTGEAIRTSLRQVTSPRGVQVTDVCQGLKLLAQGKKIKYEGASGNLNLDKNGDVVGSYDIWRVQPNGRIVVIGRVDPHL